MESEPAPILRILVGTRAGVRLAEAVAAGFGDRVRVVVALAGRVSVPGGCTVDRIGGGVPALAGAAAVIDALDPFDRDAVRAARAAAAERRVPLLAFRPPGWHRHPLDRWIEVRDLPGAAGVVAALGRTVLLALPERDLAAFEGVEGVAFPVRLPRPPARWEHPDRFTPHPCPPPRHSAADISLLRRCAAAAVVMRATGCAADAPLVEAARSLDLPVVMIRRPVVRGDAPARSAAAAIDWAEAAMAGVRRLPARDVPAWR